MEERMKPSTVETGKAGEDAALEYLLEKGLVLRERNWRAKHLEIDLIMESRDYLHIIEVRSRMRHDPVEPKDTVDKKKQQRLIRAASSYIFKNDIRKDTLFDIVSVVFDGGKPQLEYIEDAFTPICSLPKY